MRDCQIRLFPRALQHNLQQVRQYAPQAAVMAMVKADAYGHGLAAVVDSWRNLPPDLYGVAFLQEAIALRKLDEITPVVSMEGVFSLAEWQQAAALSVQCAITQPMQCDWALSHPQTAQPVWLKLNTGMNRLGLLPDQALTAARQLHQAGYRIILTQHFANADVPAHPVNSAQMTRFSQLKAQLAAEGILTRTSLCNSAALINWPDWQADIVRPGIMLYGSSPFGSQPSAQALGLQAAMQFSSRLIAIQTVAAGDSIGYGSAFTATRPMQIGVAGCGYGDGYPRTLDRQGAGRVWINGQAAPVVGRVSMDMLTIDLTGIPARVGDLVELWGSHIPVDDVAEAAGTLGYELMCRLTSRPARVQDGLSAYAGL